MSGAAGKFQETSDESCSAAASRAAGRTRRRSDIPSAAPRAGASGSGDCTHCASGERRGDAPPDILRGDGERDGEAEREGDRAPTAAAAACSAGRGTGLRSTLGSSFRGKAAAFHPAATAAAPAVFSDAAERSVLGAGGDRPRVATWCSCRGCGDTARPRGTSASRSVFPLCPPSVPTSSLRTERECQPVKQGGSDHTYRRLSRPRAPRATGVRKSNNLAMSVGAASGSHAITASASARDNTKPSFCGPQSISSCAQAGAAHGSWCAATVGAQHAPQPHPCQLEDELPGVSLACHVGGGRIERVQRNLGRIVPRQDLCHQEAVGEIAAGQTRVNAGASQDLRLAQHEPGASARRSVRAHTAARSSRCKTG